MACEPTNGDRYFEALGISKTSNNDRDLRKAAFDRAQANRSFEIELFWKRATYFWGLQAGAFAALGFVWKGGSDTNFTQIGSSVGLALVPQAHVSLSTLLLTLAVSCVGMIASLAGWRSAEASRFWQKNWEQHIDFLEDEFESAIYKTVWFDGIRKEHSVSRINIKLLFGFYVFWICVVLLNIWRLTEIFSFDYYVYTQNVILIRLVVSGIFGVLLCVALYCLLSAKSRLAGDVSTNGSDWRWQSPKPKHPLESKGIILRALPDEKLKKRTRLAPGR